MKRTFSRLVAALAIGGAMAASVPAEARGGHWGGDRGYSRHGDGGRGYGGYGGYRGGGYYRGGSRGYYGHGGYYAPRYYGYGYGYPRGRYYYHDHDNGDALVAGIAGLAIGAAIASSSGY